QSDIVGRMVEEFERSGADAVIAFETVPAEDVVQYGIAKPRGPADAVFELQDIVEKPSVAEAPSRLAVAARYVFKPVIFEWLAQRRTAHARAGLVGNPSDGYHGKTVSVIVRNFAAQVVLYEWEDVELVATELDQSRFRSVHDLVRDVKLHGYYGGMRLLKATV